MFLVLVCISHWTLTIGVKVLEIPRAHLHDRPRSGVPPAQPAVPCPVTVRTYRGQCPQQVYTRHITQLTGFLVMAFYCTYTLILYLDFLHTKPLALYQAQSKRNHLFIFYITLNIVYCSFKQQKENTGNILFGRSVWKKFRFKSCITF